jgi:DegV family protein with EDD domain
MVVKGARAARAGASLEQVKAIAERSVPRVRTVFVVHTLEYLRRGGRIGRARALLGTVLRIKPVLIVREGEVQPEARVRTMAHALDRIYQYCISHPHIREMAVGYSTNPLEAAELRNRLAAACPNVNIFMTRVGPVLGTHTGPGVMGAGLIEEEEEGA